MSGKLKDNNSISVCVDVPPGESIHSLNAICNVYISVIRNRSPPNTHLRIFVST